MKLIHSLLRLKPISLRTVISNIDWRKSRSLDTVFKAREDLQDIARAREAADSEAPVQIGAVKRNCVKDKSKCVQHLCLKDDETMVKGRSKRLLTASATVMSNVCGVRARYLTKRATAKKHLCMS